MDVEDQVARIVAAAKSRREALALELVLALHDTDPASLLRCDDALGHPLLMWCAVSGLSGLTEYLLSLAEGDGAANLVDRPASCTCGHAGQNALMWAATTAFSPYAMKCAVILLRFGASPARQDAHGCTPITHAAQVGNLPMMHLLASISPGTADLLDFQGRSPLHWAAYSGHAGVVAYCIRVLGMNGNLNDAKLFHRSEERSRTTSQSSFIYCASWASTWRQDLMYRREALAEPPSGREEQRNALSPRMFRSLFYTLHRYDLRGTSVIRWNESHWHGFIQAFIY